MMMMLSEKLSTRPSTSWRLFLLVLMVGLAASLSMAFAGDAQAKKKKKKKAKNFAKTSLVVQSGDANVQTENAKITAPNSPFSFANTNKFVSLSRISITATIEDGDSGPGEFAENDLTLALDGIDTGIKLNGYRNDETDTRTNSGVPANAAQILAALKADGKLEASIIDADAGNNNEVSIPANFQTQLEIRGKQKA